MVKDYAFAALFDKKNLPSLYKLAEKVRATHDTSLIDNYIRMCQQKVDDHNPILQVGNQNIEFIQVSKADDLVVTAGLDRCIDIILGISSTRWQYMGKGTSTGTPATSNSLLGAEVTPRVDMNIAGWREYDGMSLRFAGIFAETHATITVNECGVFTGSAINTTPMLNRNGFSTNALTHTINTSAFVLSSVIEFVPVV
jgi:hypothetical protein